MKNFITLLFVTLIFVFTSFAASFAAGLYKWPNPTKIKTYIPPNHKRTIMMKHAFAEWSRLTHNRVVFIYTSNKNNAEIVVQFVNVIPNADRQIGLTRALYDVNGRVHSAVISIAEKTADGHTLSNDNVYTVMLHEIGHSIGLDHTNNILSIMYPSEDDRQEILKSDLKNLGDIYGWK